MKVKMQKHGSALPEDISSIEKYIESALPYDFKRFLLKYDGAVVESNIFKAKGAIEGSVHQFVKAKDIIHEIKNINNIPRHTIPFAWDECGNYFLLNASTGKIYFWDHETTKNVHLANSFAEFINMLEPFDINEVHLGPGQVKSVWVDPEFLRKLKEKNHRFPER